MRLQRKPSFSNSFGVVWTGHFCPFLIYIEPFVGIFSYYFHLCLAAMTCCVSNWHWKYNYWLYLLLQSAHSPLVRRKPEQINVEFKCLSSSYVRSLVRLPRVVSRRFRLWEAADSELDPYLLGTNQSLRWLSDGQYLDITRTPWTL